MPTKHADFPSGDFLTVGEAARALGVSTDTIRRWDKDGRIQAYRTPTGHRRFHRDDVDALLKAGA